MPVPVFHPYLQTGAGRVVRKNVCDLYKVDTTVVDEGVGRPLYYDLTHGTGYGGLDRFGRVKHLKWINNDATPATLVELKYGHDTAGNRTWREDLIADSNSKHLDEFYTYDGLHRLKELDRGNLTGTPPTGLVTGSDTFNEEWTLTATGNWKTYKFDADGAGGGSELTQSRLHNPANEIDNDSTHGSASTGAITGTNCDWAEPIHDAAGNMTGMPDPKNLANNLVCGYDAWNRLIGTGAGSTATAYTYDGLGRRITLATGSNPTVTRHFYHNNQQVVEERIDSETTADRQFVWGVQYIDEMLVRDRNTTGGGHWGKNGSGLDERILPMQDANYNTVCLAEPVNLTCSVVQRFAYTAYGEAKKLNPDFTDYNGATDYEWSYLYTGRHLDEETGRV